LTDRYQLLTVDTIFSTADPNKYIALSTPSLYLYRQEKAQPASKDSQSKAVTNTKKDEKEIRQQHSEEHVSTHCQAIITAAAGSK